MCARLRARPVRGFGVNLLICCNLGRNELEIRRHYYCSGFFRKESLEVADISVEFEFSADFVEDRWECAVISTEYHFSCVMPDGEFLG